MKNLFSALLVASAATWLGSATSVSAQYFSNYIQNGNFSHGSSYGSGGYQMDMNRTRVGNFTFDNFQDNRGNRVNCTTTRIGTYSSSSCY